MPLTASPPLGEALTHKKAECNQFTCFPQSGKPHVAYAPIEGKKADIKQYGFFNRRKRTLYIKIRRTIKSIVRREY